MALALAVAPALCCCVSTAAGDDGSSCGEASCETPDDAPAGPAAPDEQPCSGDHTPELELVTASSLGKAAGPASDEHGQPGATASGRTRGGFISVGPVATGQPAARAGPLVSLLSLHTLLLN